MDIEAFRAHCLAKPGATEDLPFGEDTLVFKVCGKMFALCSIADYANGVTLKCDPEQAVELRETYTQVKPGYHMNKAHWNTILPASGLPDGLLQEWVDASYHLVATKLPKKLKQELGI
ncbi:MmcQ/YjbR family DNA-binding protein [Pontibacter sp. E15-1]|uniref:MmcQ/YjbR family DNA-binding protein n=1 Tax=Pontibacter sp. E15-1 TaxID=2919918 RepID=UPI001F4F78F0|nr:MmcQ/YjbR family DNA-binding protein [Pontibacter sp. E15-1]MCJ8163533.1 MmcQ/YjbR family DNA-binding protein [Pontibacter sp. E15-1]